MVVFPDLFLIAVSSNGIRMTGEVPNVRVALVRVHAHSAAIMALAVPSRPPATQTLSRKKFGVEVGALEV